MVINVTSLIGAKGVFYIYEKTHPHISTVNNIPLSIFLSVGGTFVLICGVLLDLSPDNLTANSIIIQSLGMVGASFLVSVLIHLFITKQMAKNS